MCSLSSTLRYCCVGPAPFDDIGDIPYHDGKADQPSSNSRISPDLSHLPRLPSSSTRSVPRHSTTPQPGSWGSSEVGMSTERRPADNRRVGNNTHASQRRHSQSSALTDYIKCCSEINDNSRQHNCNTNCQRGQSHSRQCINPRGCCCPTHQNGRPPHEDSLHSHSLHNGSNSSLQRDVNDNSFNNGDVRHDDVNMNNYHPIRPSRGDVTSGQRRSQRLASASRHLGRSLVREDSRPKAVTLLCGQGSLNCRNACTRRSDQRHSPRPCRTTVLPACPQHTVPFCDISTQPRPPTVGLPRHAWEESK
ncbi:hypothetical protein ACOMHN_062770 [Nucella lapillus]